MPEWLAAIGKFMTMWCPQFSRIPPTHLLVKWINCKDATVHGPGKPWHWPMVTDVEEVDIRWQTAITASAPLTMADGTAVSARILVVWKVGDPVLAVGENADYEERASEIGLSCIVDVLGDKVVDDLKKSKDLSKEITLEVRKECTKVGLRVKKCKFTELVAAPAMRMLND